MSDLPTMDAAWSSLRSLLISTAPSHASDAEREREAERLARFAAGHPHELERRLLAETPSLAATTASGDSDERTRARRSELSVFWTQPPPRKFRLSAKRPPPSEIVFDALDPSDMLEAFVAARPHLIAQRRSTVEFATYLAVCFARRPGAADIGTFDGLPPECRDAIRASAFGTPLPDILPHDVVSLRATEIDATIAAYVRLPIETLTARLVARGFLGPGEQLGETILRDASTLVRLGVDRHALADRLELVLDAETHATLPDVPLREQVASRIAARAGAPNGPGGTYEFPWMCEMRGCMGYVGDPFHSVDVFDWTTARGSADFKLFRRGGDRSDCVRGGDLIVTLIRRLCFFEGTVAYRVDPERTARLLGLTAVG